jgi:TonB family protein
MSVREVSARRELARHVVFRLDMTRMLGLLVVLAVAVPASADPRPVESPSLPSADRIAAWVRASVGDHPSVDVRLCTDSDGRVTSVELLRSSSYEPFDRAVLKDVAAWRFAASGDAQCAKKTIAYDPVAK